MDKETLSSQSYMDGNDAGEFADRSCRGLSKRAALPTLSFVCLIMQTGLMFNNQKLQTGRRLRAHAMHMGVM
jgi:hypothetical protein